MVHISELGNFLGNSVCIDINKKSLHGIFLNNLDHVQINRQNLIKIGWFKYYIWTQNRTLPSHLRHSNVFSTTYVLIDFYFYFFEWKCETHDVKQGFAYIYIYKYLKRKNYFVPPQTKRTAEIIISVPPLIKPLPMKFNNQIKKKKKKLLDLDCNLVISTKIYIFPHFPHSHQSPLIVLG